MFRSVETAQVDATHRSTSDAPQPREPGHEIPAWSLEAINLFLRHGPTTAEQRELLRAASGPVDMEALNPGELTWHETSRSAWLTKSARIYGPGDTDVPLARRREPIGVRIVGSSREDNDFVALDCSTNRFRLSLRTPTESLLSVMRHTSSLRLGTPGAESFAEVGEGTPLRVLGQCPHEPGLRVALRVEAGTDSRRGVIFGCLDDSQVSRFYSGVASHRRRAGSSWFSGGVLRSQPHGRVFGTVRSRSAQLQIVRGKWARILLDYDILPWPDGAAVLQPGLRVGYARVEGWVRIDRVRPSFLFVGGGVGVGYSSPPLNGVVLSEGTELRNPAAPSETVGRAARFTRVACVADCDGPNARVVIPTCVGPMELLAAPRPARRSRVPPALEVCAHEQSGGALRHFRHSAGDES